MPIFPAVDVDASNMGGVLTWKFSQADYSKVTKKHPHTKSGICEALSVSWISKSLQSGLQSALTTGDSIDSTKIAIVAQRYASMYRYKFPNGQEGREHKPHEMVTESEKYLKTQGFQFIGRVGSSVALKNQNPTLEQQFDNCFGALEEKDFFKQQNSTIYCMMRYAGNGWAHATAFRIEAGANKTSYYFDPNKGEFKFLTYDKFRKWYEHYHQKSRLYRTSRQIGFNLFVHKDR
ncbi:YopT-type cysteine protease domain-containing protein [Microbulbifer sp. ZKSA006]|uniref:YopT-type cysteine protease domain-containing protein n=1 Tax=Microbulbifer sp. ZKSA006 TaxID=3243390 RepID=UPI0040394314